MHYSFTYQLAKKKHYEATCTTMSLSRQSTSKLKAPFIRTWLWPKKNYQCTQPGAWGLQRKRTLYIYTKEKSVFQKKKKNSKQNIWKYLYSLKRSYWQFLKWNFSWGMDTHTHTSYWLDYCTIFHWQVELKKS